jgi:hypothetical protein|tara:strand:- start:130 stop:246 length:117 start_codon:yes stop_codon:yes gene_type:complete
MGTITLGVKDFPIIQLEVKSLLSCEGELSSHSVEPENI